MSETFEKSQMSESFDVPAGCFVSESYQTRINPSDIYVTHYVKVSSSQKPLKLVANQDLPKVGSPTLEVSPIQQYTNIKISK